MPFYFTNNKKLKNWIRFTSESLRTKKKFVFFLSPVATLSLYCEINAIVNDRLFRCFILVEISLHCSKIRSTNNIIFNAIDYLPRIVYSKIFSVERNRKWTRALWNAFALVGTWKQTEFHWQLLLTLYCDRYSDLVRLYWCERDGADNRHSVKCSRMHAYLFTVNNMPSNRAAFIAWISCDCNSIQVWMRLNGRSKVNEIEISESNYGCVCAWVSRIEPL